MISLLIFPCLWTFLLADVCEFTLKDYTYNFNALRTDQDYVPDTKEYQYFINFCGNAISHKDCTASICQFSKTTQKVIFNLAYWEGSTPLNWSFIDSSNPSAGLTFKSTNGASCYGSKDNRIVTMHFPCTPDANGRQIEVTTDNGPACAGDGYVFKFPTCYSCPNGCNGSGMSQGSTLIILFIVISLVYISLGCWYNHRTYESPYGVESFPHLEYWKMVPGLVADGIKFSSQHATQVFNRLNEKIEPIMLEIYQGQLEQKRKLVKVLKNVGY